MTKMKIVLNISYGGFSLSDEAIVMLQQMTGNKNLNRFSYLEEDLRGDKNLIAAVEKLGQRANGKNANLIVTEIPTGAEIMIMEEDGWEFIEEDI